MILYGSTAGYRLRTAARVPALLATLALACVSVPSAGPLDDGATRHPRITVVDTTRPPRSVWVDLDQPGYAAVLLVAPGHSATLLYPGDSSVDNHLTAGTHNLAFRVPDAFVRVDSLRNLAGRPGSERGRVDSSIFRPGRMRSDTSRAQRVMPVNPTTPTYLLLLTSSQPLSYQRIVDKTAGVSIPSLETEALNAVEKAVKATIASEPRDIAGYYQRVELNQRR